MDEAENQEEGGVVNMGVGTREVVAHHADVKMEIESVFIKEADVKEEVDEKFCCDALTD
jgi:hypothetical protein